MFGFLSDELAKQGGHLIRAWKETSSSNLVQIIDSAKNRLLDFVLELESYAEKSGKGLGGIQPLDVEKLVHSLIFGTPNIIFKGDVNMARDQYNIGQAGAVGPDAKVENSIFNQVQLTHQGELDITELSEELSLLREAMAKDASEPKHYIEIGSIAEAETEAKKGNKSKALESLAKAGKWSLDIATAIGTRVAAEAIKASLGM